MSILSQYLKKIGVTSLEELTNEEKETYSAWESALNGRQMTDKEVRLFMEIELEQAINKLTSLSLGEREDTFMKMKVDFIRKLSAFLDAPKKEKEQVEQLINNQI